MTRIAIPSDLPPLIKIGRLDQVVQDGGSNGTRYTMDRAEVERIEAHGVRGFIIPPKAAP